MEDYQKEFALDLAETGALFFSQGLRLKDGRPTPYFVNMGLFRTGRLNAKIGSYIARMIEARGLLDQIDVLVGPSYKGSALAVAVAQALWNEKSIDLAFEYDRKEAKTHGEATGRVSRFVTGALTENSRLFILDDVATTMGTKYDLIDKLDKESAGRKLNLRTIGVGLAVDREQTTVVRNDDGVVVEGVKGDDAVALFTQKTGLPVYTLAGIRQVVEYLAEAETPVMINGIPRPIDPTTLKNFRKYVETYGVDR